MIVNIGETVAKSRTIDGLPCILVERQSDTHGKPCESEIICIFADTELGHALADELVEKLNCGKLRT